jgi:hypothetical protein
LVSSKILYAKKHCQPPTATFERIGLALKGFTHMIVSSGLDRRASHGRSIVVALRPSARAPTTQLRRMR